MVAKGGDYKAAVIEVFGTSNYKSEINKMKPSEINDCMRKLMNKISGIVEKVDISTLNSESAFNSIINDSSFNYNGTSLSSASAVCSYYVTDSGSIKFVNYGVTRGVFDDIENAELNNLFNNKIRNKLEETYSSEIKTLNLSNTEKDNIFNQALFMALSDRSVMLSMYETTSLSKIVEAVCENYTQILTKISNDENARKYFKNINGNSLLAGRNTGTGTKSYNTNADVSRNLNKYYQDGTTQGEDDWTLINSRGTETFNYGGGSGSIVVLTISAAGDRDAVNNAIKSILKDFIDLYSSYISADRIIELYKEAQEIAFGNLETTVDNETASGSAIYGYGECKSGSERDNTDTRKTSGSNIYYGVNSILINVIYEMEKLLTKEIMGA